jgi:hypothetical protein
MDPEVAAQERAGRRWTESRGWLIRSYVERRAGGGHGEVSVVGIPCGATNGGGADLRVGVPIGEGEGSIVGLDCDGSSGSPALERAMADHFERAFEIWKARQRKYGSDNIARRGPAGVMVRLDDKMARLDRAFAGGASESADETVTDTCYDVANYALIALACHKGEWPGWPHR